MTSTQLQTTLIQDLKNAFSTAWDQTEFELDCCLRAEVPIPPIDLNNWLISQPNARKWASHTPQGNHVGIEMSDELLGDSPAELETALHLIKTRLNFYPKNTRYIGGIACSTTSVSKKYADETPYFHFIIPKYEITEKEGIYTFATTLIPDLLETREEHWIKIEKDIQRMVWQPTEPPEISAYIRIMLPNEHDWNIIIEKTKKAIQENRFQKSVLARDFQFTPVKPLSCTALYAHLQQTHPLVQNQEYTYLFQWQHNHAFLSRSPETLFHKTGDTLYTEAIAGTRHKGTTPEERDTLAQELRQSAKDQEEHEHVKTHLKTQLGPLCLDVTIPDTPTILTLPTLQHLHTPIQAKLKPGVSDAQLIQALHPTPAVCGTPTKEAMQWIEQNEPFKREWYAGLVGSITKTETHFSVAIRSAFFAGNTLHTYAGAGIIGDSDPTKEWEELNIKTQHWLTLLKFEE